MHVTAIVPCAGSGKRLRSRTRKPYVRLNGRPVIVHTLKALSKSRLIRDFIIVARKTDFNKIRILLAAYNIRNVINIVEGGKERFDSVFNGLSHVPAKTDIVLIHDCARPFVKRDLIDRSIREASRHGAAVAALKANATIKESKNSLYVGRTLKRDHIYLAQTPQVFKKGLIETAYKKARGLKSKPTDDSALVERLGKKVRIVPGSVFNIKITTREDIGLANAILKINRQGSL